MPTNIYREAVEAFGDHNQMLKAVEELGELVSAITRYMAADPGDMQQAALLADRVSEEMADVEIMLAQLKVMLSNSSDVLLWKGRKRERLAARIRE